MPSPTEPQSRTESIPLEPSILVKAFASGLFSGYAPIASGTVGSAVGAAVYLIPGFEHPYVIMPMCFLVFLAGVKTSEIMEERYGHDPAEVTIDEVLGMWMSLLLLPKTWMVIVAGFVLFRLMDIIKPFPARKFEGLKGGAGIMLDDVVAAVYANIILHLLLAVPFFKKLLL